MLCYVIVSYVKRIKRKKIKFNVKIVGFYIVFNVFKRKLDVKDM